MTQNPYQTLPPLENTCVGCHYYYNCLLFGNYKFDQIQMLT